MFLLLFARIKTEFLEGYRIFHTLRGISLRYPAWCQKNSGTLWIIHGYSSWTAHLPGICWSLRSCERMLPQIICRK